MIYLESANSSSFDNCTIENLDLAFEELEQSDEEHGAFWVVDEDENVLEIHKNLQLFIIYSGDSENQIIKQLKDINQARLLFVELINGNIEQLKGQVENIKK
ncbi:hypothetical protein LPB248_13255 [Flavobacterium sp. LPB0248]|uniref:hypothetical protein n=1 Tax=Flavobacterium sp. LPB0248 TaxID=2614441 RepID=UPI0015A6A564|nr:hypothetical protein [Flavobacterium sp. LPB0248]QLC67230.1 hypothetical protein LPB248_13255 [Flavobacterium sp. LPB0248]